MKNDKIQEVYEREILGIREAKKYGIQESMGINEAKVNLQFRISPRRSKMRVVKNLDQIFKDYTKEEIRDSNIDIIVDGEVVGSFSGAKLSYRVK
jgi:hypothetical protein